MRVSSLSLVVLLGSACTELTAGPPTWSRDIGPLAQAKCGQCHRENGIAPFPLQSRADFVAEEPIVRNQVSSRQMPPWPASNDCADYTPNGSLSDAEIAKLIQWFDNGAPEGNPGQQAVQIAQPTGLSRVDVSLPMREPYQPSLHDDYRCFIIDWDEARAKYITGFNIKPGQPQLVHHADLFYLRPNAVATYQGYDDADPGPGYECYFIPNTVSEGAWIGTFVPGSLGADFPAGSGLHIAPKSKLLLQVHYNLTNGGQRLDTSSVELSLADQVEREGTVQAWVNPEWMSNRTSMNIPAGQKDVGHRFAADPTQVLTLFNQTFTDNQPVNLFMATGHMHQKGTSFKVEIEREDGSRTCVLDIPKWSFHWQLPYVLSRPVTLNPKDKLAVECHWDNSAENQAFVNGVRVEPADITWGPRTVDEMCIAGVYLAQ